MMRALLTFGAFTLMRPSELVALDWDDIDLSGPERAGPGAG